MAIAVATCAGPGAELTLRPITVNSLTEVPLFTGTVPTRAGQNAYNPLRYRADVNAFARGWASAVDRAITTDRREAGADPIGALAAAGQTLHLRSGTKRVIVAVFNGWQQTRAVNLFRYRESPSDSTLAVIRSLRRTGELPNLAGTDVVVAGITSGDPRMQTNAAQLAGLCRVWKDLVASGGGALKLCSAALPGIVTSF